MLKRASGILLPVSSLPGPWGIGTLGEEARRFVDFLAAAGQTYWQILPVGPTGYGDSPYQSFSAFAANPYFIDPGILIRQGLLTEAEAEADWGEDPARVDYGALYKGRHALLQKAADRLPDGDEDFAAWQQEQSVWLEDYALFMALKEENDQQSWYHWPDEVRLRRPDALAKARQRLAGRVDYWRKIQYLFYRQWDELLAYAHQKGVEIIGDIPIYVSPDSSDIWAAPELFQTDGDRRLTRVAGCPRTPSPRTASSGAIRSMTGRITRPPAMPGGCAGCVMRLPSTMWCASTTSGALRAIIPFRHRTPPPRTAVGSPARGWILSGPSTRPCPAPRSSPRIWAICTPR